MYDVIIVGARCAGSALAMLLSRQGAKVLLLDRATFPSDIPHGHLIYRHGPRRLQRWGVLDRLTARTPPIRSMLFDVGDFPLVARELVEDGVALGYGPRRKTFDGCFAEIAVESGAELRTGVCVTDYLIEGGRVAGIRGRERDGDCIKERATITVGADGRYSRLARTVQAPTYNYVPTILCYYFSYWSGFKGEDFELYDRSEQKRIIFGFKTEDNLFAVFVGLPIAELSDTRRDVEGSFMRAVDVVPDFAERIRAGRREERFCGASDLPNAYRKPYGPGWALVGDAGLHKDPYLALGMCDALRDTEFLAEAITQGMTGQHPIHEALAGYETRRNEASASDYQENIARAQFKKFSPQFMAVRAAVRHRPDEARNMIKAVMGMTDPDRFLGSDNLGRLLGGGLEPLPV